MTPELVQVADLYNINPERLTQIHTEQAKQLENIRKKAIPTLTEILGLGGIFGE